VIFTEPLSDEHGQAVAKFRCTRHPHTEELTDFLQRKALPEQHERLSSTTLFFTEGSDRIDAFVTLGASFLKAPPEFKARLERHYLPVVIMDYLAVADHRLAAERGFGHKVFMWVVNQVVRQSEAIGVRMIMLEVRAGNWHAYRQDSRRWGFQALPLRPYRGDPACEPPDPQGDRPQDLNPDRLIGMYFDLAPIFGPAGNNPEE
jgi:hypothetical protein